MAQQGRGRGIAFSTAHLITICLILSGAAGCSPMLGGETGGKEPVESSDGQKVVIKEPVTIIDRSGAELGQGEVRLYAPETIRYPEPATIRLEIEAAKTLAEITETASPETAPSTTPAASTSVTLHEIMGASLGGVDIVRFEVSAIPESGERAIADDEVNWWEWHIRPTSPDAVGPNYLEVTIYLPRESADGHKFNQEVSVMPVQITITGPTPTPLPTPTPTPSPLAEAGSTLVNWASAITAVAGLASLIWAGYQILRRRLRKPE